MIKDTIIWERIDKPGSESSVLILKGSKRLLKGSSVFLHDNSPCCLNYTIQCNDKWETEYVKVNGWLDKSVVGIEIKVDENKNWLLNNVKVPQVKMCVDIDLNFSPSTNLLPIRRLNLSENERKDVKAVWLRFPSFTLEPLEQSYKKIDKKTYLYESAGGKFKRELKVNKEGFVISYPDFFEILKS